MEPARYRRSDAAGLLDPVPAPRGRAHRPGREPDPVRLASARLSRRASTVTPGSRARSVHRRDGPVTGVPVAGAWKGSMERVIESADGRALAVTEYGDLGGYPVLVHMGTPNPRRLYGPNVTDAAARGLRLISYDRPGYGGSTAQPGRSVADCAADVRAICAELGISRLAMWGISGGGPHVLACAALLPDLVVAAASLAGEAPYGAEGLDWFDGMGQLNVDDIRLFFADETAARAQLDKEREQALAASPDEMAAGLESLLSPADK